MSDSQKNPWTTLSARDVYDNAWISLTEYQVINPAGNRGIYGKVHFKNKAIGIVPVDEKGFTYLVGQYRYTLDAWSWEIPEGGGPLDTDPLDSAKRELREETGLSASQWTPLQVVHLSNSVSDEEGIVYLAEGLQKGNARLEDTEADLRVWHLPLAEALQMVVTGKITDSLSIIGILRATTLLPTTKR